MLGLPFLSESLFVTFGHILTRNHVIDKIKCIIDCYNIINLFSYLANMAVFEVSVVDLYKKTPVGS